MNKEFDFNINNYNSDDIKTILSIPENYDINIINECYQEKIEECSKRNASKEILIFLKQIKEKLISDIKTTKLTNQTSTFNTSSNSVLEKNTAEFGNLIDRHYRLNPIEVLPTQIARSNLNTIKRKTKTVTLVFNTKFINPLEVINSNNEYMFILPNMFKDVFSMKLSSLQLPNSVYAFGCHNNIFYIKENNTGKEGKITIGEGNYSSDEFPEYLTDLINETLNSETRFEVLINTHTGKLSIINPVNTFSVIFNIEINGNLNSNCFYKELCCDPILEFEEDNENLKDTKFNKHRHYDFHISAKYNKNNCGQLLGFKKTVYKDVVEMTGETLFNINPFNYLYFCLDDYNKSQYNSIIGILSNSLINNNVLAVVPMSANYFSYHFDNTSDNIEKKREYFGPINLVKLSVKLLDEFGESIDLNGQHFSFSLELETAYDW